MFAETLENKRGCAAMSDNTTKNIPNEERRKMLALLLAGGTIATVPSACAKDEKVDEGLNNSLLWAVAWKQTAAEYQALCYQAYNLARMRLDVALQQRKAGDRP